VHSIREAVEFDSRSLCALQAFLDSQQDSLCWQNSNVAAGFVFIPRDQSVGYISRGGFERAIYV